MHRALPLLCLLLTPACTYHRAWVVVDGEPQGARVRLNGVDIGKTPTGFSDTGTASGKAYRVEVSAPGYEKREVTLRQEYRSTCIAAAIPGIILWPFLINFLWCQSLPEERYRIDLEPQSAGASGGSVITVPGAEQYTPPRS